MSADSRLIQFLALDDETRKHHDPAQPCYAESWRGAAWEGVSLLRFALAQAHEALRHIARTADTLSPQEFINVCANGLGEPRHEYAGECDPNRSIVQYRIAARVVEREREATQGQIRASEVHVMKYHTCSSGEDCPLLP